MSSSLSMISKDGEAEVKASVWVVALALQARLALKRRQPDSSGCEPIF
jgi:hypothetical protein